ncbi:MAG TPA: hypothetical protein VGI39_15815 [Polyangiaceae bacterium]|jgi:mannose-6-phosphate isomerase-like protein (cupin superfamily)
MTQIQVISRNTIPPLSSVMEGGEVRLLGELRDFRWNDSLRSFMPDPSRFSVSWVRLVKDEELKPHVHPIHTMMVFYEGSGQMLGDLHRAIRQNDAVVVPAGCAHGFIGGPEGLYGLSIQFGEGLYTAPEKPRVRFVRDEDTARGIFDYNEARRRSFSESPLFALLGDGSLRDERRRTAFLGALPDSPRERTRDSTVKAVASWFAYQMNLLDDAEKAALLLAVDSAEATYATRAAPNVGSSSLNLRPAGLSRGAYGEGFLRRESPRGYGRVRSLLEESWDMIGALSDRVVEIARAAR